MAYGIKLLTRLMAVCASALVLLMMAGSVSAKPVTGAVSTTDNPGWLDSYDTYVNVACLNHGPINCNQYSDKRDVWLSGLPDSAHLNDGTYFFAILVPGNQQNPNDGAPGNLSSPNDTYADRTFTLSNGVISYPAAVHDFDVTKNRLQAYPYDDTTNPGGVYILAVCQYDPTSVSGSPGVDPSSCKYDAFKIQNGVCQDCNGGLVPPPTITKDAEGGYTNTFAWNISKLVDKTTVDIVVGKTWTFNYTVGVTVDTGTISGVGVAGTIEVLNSGVDQGGNTVPLNITGVTDQMKDTTTTTVCTVTGGGTQTLTNFATDFPYSCSLAGLPTGQLDNTATVEWPDQSGLSAGSTSFTFPDVQFTEAKVDDCVSVSDTYANNLGTTCVSTEFKYSRELPAPAAGTCVKYDNTATFTTDDQGLTGSSSQTVQVCGFNSALTPGYWKNHAAKTGSTGCSSLKYSSCSSNGPWDKFPQLVGNYSVSSILIADPIWGGMNCSSTTDQGAIGCLAGHLLAAKFNRANLSLPCIDPTIADADTFLKAGVVGGVTGVTYIGPTGTYNLSAAQRSTAIGLKSKLDAYNNSNTCP